MRVTAIGGSMSDTERFAAMSRDLDDIDRRIDAMLAERNTLIADLELSRETGAILRRENSELRLERDTALNSAECMRLEREEWKARVAPMREVVGELRELNVELNQHFIGRAQIRLHQLLKRIDLESQQPTTQENP